MKRMGEWTNGRKEEAVTGLIPQSPNSPIPQSHARRSRAFTLIELLVVLAIIIILIGLLSPFFFGAEEKADRAKCLSNVRQLATAAASQFGEYGGDMPPRANALSWGEGAQLLLPYLKNVIGVFDCPANPGNEAYGNCLVPGTTFYVDYELNGFLCATPGSSRKQNRITDYSLTAYAYDYPYDPAADNNPDRSFWRAHEGGINVAYLDGHAAWLADDQMGNVANPGDDGSEFYAKGHDFWQY